MTKRSGFLISWEIGDILRTGQLARSRAVGKPSGAECEADEGCSCLAWATVTIPQWYAGYGALQLLDQPPSLLLPFPYPFQPWANMGKNTGHKSGSCRNDLVFFHRRDVSGKTGSLTLAVSRTWNPHKVYGNFDRKDLGVGVRVVGE